MALGLVQPSGGQPQDTSVAATPISLSVSGESITVWITPSARPFFRQRFKELARIEKRRAADAGNAANTSQLVAGGFGAALATGGLIALATAAGPIAAAAVVATGAGAIVAAVGLIAGHAMNEKKFEHEQRMDYYSDIAEDLK